MNPHQGRQRKHATDRNRAIRKNLLFLEKKKQKDFIRLRLA